MGGTKKTQIELPELKTTKSEMESTLSANNERLNTVA